MGGLPGGITDATGARQNPATEEKQDDIITAIGAIGGGGVQYTEGDTDASITGTVSMMEGAGNTILPIQGTVADGILVNLGANNDVTVSGTITEANSAAIKTAVEIIDDWDNAASDGASVSGDVAHGSADAGEPVKIGFKSASATSLPTATDVGDRTNLAGSTQGEAYVYNTRLDWSEDETNELGRTTIKPISANTYNLNWENSTALETSSVVKASAGNAYIAHVFNNNAAVRYFQVYNSTTVPADTAVPIFSIPVAAGGYVRIVFGLESGAPYHFSTGISWAISTTYATKTIGGSDMWVNFGYM